MEFSRQDPWTIADQAPLSMGFSRQDPWTIADHAPLSVGFSRQDPWTIADQAPLSVGFSRQERWRGLPFPSPQSSAIELWTPTDSCLCPFPLLELAIRKQVLRLKIWWVLVTFYSSFFFYIASVLPKESKVNIHI